MRTVLALCSFRVIFVRKIVKHTLKIKIRPRGRGRIWGRGGGVQKIMLPGTVAVYVGDI